jgi:GT2 family glycosyltransferase
VKTFVDGRGKNPDKGGTGIQLLNGHVDHCHGRYIMGWALPVRPDGHCRITVADSTGRIIAGAVASEPRADLAAVGGGRIDFAFRVGVPLTDAPGPVRVQADGVDLPNSPVFLEADIFDGELSIDCGVVSGWVANRCLLGVTEPVTLFDQDGHLVLTIPTRQDPADTDPLFRPARFAATLPAHCFGGHELCLTAKIGDATVARTFGSCRLEGYLDKITGTICAGWLFSPDASGRCFEIAVYRDGVMVGDGATTMTRDDVSRRHAPAGECGFEFALIADDQPFPGLTHVSIRLAGSQRELFDGPFLLGSRAEAAQEAYNAAGIAARMDLVLGNGSAILRDAFADWLRGLRSGPADFRIRTRPLAPAADSMRRLSIVIPVFSDVAATRLCFESVMRTRRLGRDAVVIVNDNPADPAIAELIDAQARHPDVFILRNGQNIGFVESANRAMNFVHAGDILLLNADTELFSGAIDEMHRVLHGSPDIGTVTALSSNATLFSYPHPSGVEEVLDDIAWPDLAAVALRENAGQSVFIPTAHGFCMLIRRDVVAEIGLFDLAFGRGYGEENDFSIRAADRGWRHVLAGGVLVRHDESASFRAEKPALLATNLGLLSERYPEYNARIRAFAAADPVRRLRWPLDFHRLRRFRQAGFKIELIVENWLDGGTARAAADIDAIVHTPDVHLLHLMGAKDGTIALHLEGLQIHSVFRPEDAATLFDLLATLDLERVVVHHLLGFTQDFVRGLHAFIASRPSVFHVHDYYYVCPRVTMIDASGAFCGGAAPDRCVRCIGLDGTHNAYRMTEMTPAEHRKLFQDMLSAASSVIAPSRDTADRLAALIPGSRPVAVPHPQTGVSFPIGVRRGTMTDICLFGAIGPHKGSSTLLALARLARLNHPEFRFHVIGYTNVDEALLAVGNVTISGKYDPEALPALVEASGARIALFLHGWPETFSYTLTEAVGLGLIPVVPDVGAPADRIRAAGFGVVFPFPIDLNRVMSVLGGIGDGTVAFNRDGALPVGFDTSEAHEQLRSLYHEGGTARVLDVPKPRRRKAASR